MDFIAGIAGAAVPSLVLIEFVRMHSSGQPNDFFEAEKYDDEIWKSPPGYSFPIRFSGMLAAISTLALVLNDYTVRLLTVNILFGPTFITMLYLFFANLIHKFMHPIDTAEQLASAALHPIKNEEEKIKNRLKKFWADEVERMEGRAQKLKKGLLYEGGIIKSGLEKAWAYEVPKLKAKVLDEVPKLKAKARELEKNSIKARETQRNIISNAMDFGLLL